MTSSVLVDPNGKAITKELTEMFVVLERGLPVAVCASERSVREVVNERDIKTIRVHLVKVDWR